MPDLQEIPIGKLKVGERELRMEGKDEALDELAASIGRIGIIVPLVVVAAADQFTLVSGHRRLAAAKQLGLKTVPCIVKDVSVDKQVEVSFAENIFRQDLSPIEVAAGIKDILEHDIIKLPDLAAVMHRSENWVRGQVLMLDWPADVLELIHGDKLSVAAASNLALVTDDSYRSFLLENALENGATARTTAAWLQAFRSMAPPEAAVQAEPEPGRQVSQPALPQAPCIVCNNVNRTDAMSMVLICSGCINSIRGVSAAR